MLFDDNDLHLHEARRNGLAAVLARPLSQELLSQVRRTPPSIGRDSSSASIPQSAFDSSSAAAPPSPRGLQGARAGAVVGRGEDSARTGAVDGEGWEVRPARAEGLLVRGGTHPERSGSEERVGHPPYRALRSGSEERVGVEYPVAGVEYGNFVDGSIVVVDGSAVESRVPVDEVTRGGMEGTTERVSYAAAREMGK